MPTLKLSLGGQIKFANPKPLCVLNSKADPHQFVMLLRCFKSAEIAGEMVELYCSADP